ncbi:MAG: pyridoxal 5'-phosphate synthase glutaminase subunit PdxT [Acidimicrobiia bacterium]
MKVGVLALQGAFREHAEVLTALGTQVRLVRTPAALADVDALVLPGGESTTIGMLLRSSQLGEPLRAALRAGMPALATCAGLIVCASTILDGRPDQVPLGVLDVAVRRNGYGRQRDSFEASLDIDGVGAFSGVFIRAPKIESVGSAVTVLASVGEQPVLVRQGALWGATFHPELSGDPRLHQAFLEAAAAGR